MISVCLASYNGEKYIKEQIDSILLQLSDDDELIISDDGSTDNTLSIINSFNDRRIKIYNHCDNNNSYKYSKTHYKVTANFENALKHAKGDYIFLSDQDDVWIENKVTTMITALQKYVLVMSNFSIINEKGCCVDNVHYLTNPISRFFINNLIKMPFYGCCIALKKELLEELLPFPKKLIMHDNWIGLYANFKRYKIGYIEIPLIKYRRHQYNVSPSSNNNINPLWFKIKYRAIIFIQLIKKIVPHK